MIELFNKYFNFNKMIFTHRSIVRSVSLVRKVHVEAKIQQLGLVLPPVGAPKGSYRGIVQTGNYLFLAGTAHCIH